MSFGEFILTSIAVAALGVVAWVMIAPVPL